MSSWLQEEMKKTEEYRKKKTPTSKNIIAAIIIFVLIEAALLTANRFTPNYNTLPLCGMVGAMGILIVLLFASKSKTAPNKPKLPIAVNCIKTLNMSDEEVRQFDAEMMAAPLAHIQDTGNSEIYINITEHYIVSAFAVMGEKDYGIFRISDIAMTCSEAGKSPSTLNPLDKVYVIDLLDAQGRMLGGGIVIDGRKSFEQFQEALEKYAPDIRLNVPMKEVKQIRKNA